MWCFYFFGAAFIFRLSTLLVSIRHETLLEQEGAVEYGRTNSNCLAVAHTLFYIAVLTEAMLRKPVFDTEAELGILLYTCGAIVLLAVMKILGPLWTVKLYISRNHVLNQHLIFRVFRHPNYYMAVIPELIGLAVGLHAFWTLGIGLVFYAIPLSNRITEETSVMRAHFAEY